MVQQKKYAKLAGLHNKIAALRADLSSIDASDELYEPMQAQLLNLRRRLLDLCSIDDDD